MTTSNPLQFCQGHSDECMSCACSVVPDECLSVDQSTSCDLGTVYELLHSCFTHGNSDSRGNYERIKGGNWVVSEKTRKGGGGVAISFLYENKSQCCYFYL